MAHNNEIIEKTKDEIYEIVAELSNCDRPEKSERTVDPIANLGYDNNGMINLLREHHEMKNEKISMLRNLFPKLEQAIMDLAISNKQDFNHCCFSDNDIVADTWSDRHLHLYPIEIIHWMCRLTGWKQVPWGMVCSNCGRHIFNSTMWIPPSESVIGPVEVQGTCGCKMFEYIDSELKKSKVTKRGTKVRR